MKKKLALFSIMVILLLTSCGNSYRYQQIAKGANQKTIEDTMGKAPDDSREESGMTFLEYKECPYLDYKGTGTYCLTEDALNYSKWEYASDTTKGAKDAYSVIKADLQKQYGEGEETTDNGEFWVCSWYISEDSTVSLTCTTANSEFTVSLLSTVS